MTIKETACCHSQEFIMGTKEYICLKCKKHCIVEVIEVKTKINLYDLKKQIQKDLLILLNGSETEKDLLFKLAGFYGDTLDKIRNN